MSKAAITETYYDVEKLLHKMVWKFQEKHGGCHDELMSEANALFMKAYNSMSKGPNKTVKMSTWLTQIVYYGLIDYLNNTIKQQTRFPRDPDTDVNWLAGRRDFDMSHFLDNLSDDAKMVAKLATDPPADILLSAKCGRGRHHGVTMRKAIMEFLYDIGWAT